MSISWRTHLCSLMRAVHEASQSGIGDGRVVYFLWGLREGVPVDEVLQREELESIQDDVRLLSSHGYAVVQANHEDSMALTDGRPDLSTFRRWAERTAADPVPSVSERLEQKQFW